MLAQPGIDGPEQVRIDGRGDLHSASRWR
jgi:hypothetical protein